MVVVVVVVVTVTATLAPAGVVGGSVDTGTVVATVVVVLVVVDEVVVVGRVVGVVRLTTVDGFASVGPDSSTLRATVVEGSSAVFGSAPIDDEIRAPNTPSITPIPRNTQRGRRVEGSDGAWNRWRRCPHSGQRSSRSSLPLIARGRYPARPHDRHRARTDVTAALGRERYM